MNYDSEKNFEENIEAFLISEAGGFTKATDAGYKSAESVGKAEFIFLESFGNQSFQT